MIILLLLLGAIIFLRILIGIFGPIIVIILYVLIVFIIAALAIEEERNERK